MVIVPQHIKLSGGRIEKSVLVAGDPGRIKELSGLLDRPKLLNSYRFLVYSGEYKGKPVSLVSHGIGGPSAAIAVEEIHALGAKNVIRLGSCGALQDGLNVGDLIVPTSAGYDKGGVVGTYVPNVNLAPAPDYKLTSVLIEKLVKAKQRYTSGPVFSSDVFYKEPRYLELLVNEGFLAVEMECATIFAIGQLRGFKTASLLMVVDNPIKKLPIVSKEKIYNVSLGAGRTVLDALTDAS